ncbi:hypothetical protein [Paenibacillus gorillae]|uniref:hypothetical protein n=1 Tax=Paenibacillus gorillae TaxID=1243662 RepID=UPI0004B8069E|nr:hypothetical protein [Paenibacillus gorillae]
MYIITSMIVTLLPFIIVLYDYWDSHQPKLGAVGSGVRAGFDAFSIIMLIIIFLAGVLNLIVALKRYQDFKKSQS